MKSKFYIVTIALLACLTLPAFAQRSWDTFYPTRTLVFGAQQMVGAISWSNAPADIRIFDGVASVTLFSQTNGAGTLTATLCQSKDITNWVAISNIVLSTSAAIIYTNGYVGGTNFYATNTWYLPGSFVTPTAYTAGWATTYLNPNLATASGALTVPASGVVYLGFNAGDCYRYFNILYTQTGATATNTVAATLSGFTHGEVNVKP